MRVRHRKARVRRWEVVDEVIGVILMDGAVDDIAIVKGIDPRNREREVGGVLVNREIIPCQARGGGRRRR
jgi:hypothetical protein